MPQQDFPPAQPARPGFFITLQAILALLVWLYIIWRAVTLSITQDEAYSYYLAKTDYWKAMPGSANTHWLNTICMRLFLFLPGTDDPWKLRMLSMISFPLYAFSVWKLSGMFTNKWIGFACFLVLLLNPFLLFFFSLGRGYAAACAAMAFSLWLITEKFRRPQTEPRRWLAVFTWACIAVLCNFTALYYLLALSVCYLLLLYKEHGLNLLARRKSRPLIHMVISTCCFSAASLLFINYYSGDLEHGGRSNLPGSLFGSLVSNSIYIRLPAIVKTTVGGIILIILTGVGLYQLYRVKKTHHFNYFTFLLLVLLSIILLNFSFHFFFGIPYLLDRTTLILFPLLTFCLFFIFSKMVRSVHRLVIATTASVVIFLTVLNFTKSFSLDYFKEWPMQENSVRAYDFLQQHKAKHVAMDVWQYSVLHNYYRQAFPGRFQFRYEMVNHRHLSDSSGTTLLTFDYLLLSVPFQKKAFPAHWNIVLKDSITPMTLLANPSFDQPDLKEKQ